MADRTELRNIEEAKLDARYGARFHALNERLLRRIHDGILFVKFIAGASAFSLLFKDVDPFWGLVGAAFLTVMVGVELVYRPIERAFEHRAFCERYAALLNRRDLFTLEDFDRALAQIYDEGVGLSALEMVAFNRNVLSAGYPSYIEPLTPWQRFLNRLV